MKCSICGKTIFPTQKTVQLEDEKYVHEDCHESSTNKAKIKEWARTWPDPRNRTCREKEASQ